MNGVRYAKKCLSYLDPCPDSAKEHQTYRQEHSQSVLETYLDWLKQIKSKAAPKGPLGEVMIYCLNQRKRLGHIRHLGTTRTGTLSHSFQFYLEFKNSA